MATTQPARLGHWRCGRRTRSRPAISRIRVRWCMPDRATSVNPWLILGMASGAILLAQPSAAADAGHGKTLFAACIACHTETPDALGPSLKGVVGRKVGSLDDFRYSS